MPLADQRRDRWDRAAIDEAVGLLNDSLRRTEGTADRFQLEAAIAVEHARAATGGSTDWPEIVRLYDLLISVHPADSARLARAVAVAEAEGPSSGLQALEGLTRDQRWHAVRAELLARRGELSAAVEEMTRSLNGAVSLPEVRHRRRQIAEWSARLGGMPGRADVS